jgi:hypothetical protein
MSIEENRQVGPSQRENRAYISDITEFGGIHEEIMDRADEFNPNVLRL